MSETSSLSVVIHRREACTPIRLTRDAIAPRVGEVVVIGGLADEDAPPPSWPLAISRALESARGPLVLLLHADVDVGPAALEAMARRLRDPAVGAVGPVLIGQDGARRRCFGRFYWPDWLPARRTLRVPLLSSACLMTRTDVLRELGGFRGDLLAPLNEEYDWCVRLAKAGYQLERVPERVRCGASPIEERVHPMIDLQRGFLYLAQSLRERPPRPSTPAANGARADASSARPS